MAQYDGSIRIVTEISTNAAKKSLATLSNTITKTAKEISSLRSKMDALKGQKFYTDDCKKLQADLSIAEKKLAELVLKQDEWEKLGITSGSAWDTLNEEIAKASDNVDAIKEKMHQLEEAGKVFTMGEDTQEYANLEKQLQHEEEALRLATQHYQAAEKLNDPYGRLSQALNDLKSKMSGIVRMAQVIKHSFSSSDVNVSGYERLNSTWSELKGTACRVAESIKSSFSDIRENGIWAIVDMTNRMSSSLVSRIGDAFERTSEKIGEILMKPVAAAMKAGQSIKYALGSAFDSIKEKAAGFAGSAINGILHPFQTIKSVASSALNGTANILKSTLTAALESIKARAAGMTATIINGIAHPFQTMRTIAGSAISSASQLLSGMASAAKRAGSTIKSMASSILHIGKNSKKASSGIAGMSMGFKNLLKYGLGIRSLYALVSKFRTAVKEGFKNLAQVSDPVNKSLSSLKSSLTQLKNSFATAFAPILTTIAPALTTFINMVSKAVTYVGMLIAALTGQKTFTKATAVQEDYAASLDSTAKSAKNANKQLSGLDKLNNLTSNDSGGGGGGAGGGISPGDMFETVDIPSKFKNLSEMIKEAWKKADFTEIGTMIGTKLKNALDNIPWDGIKKTANKIGKSIATLINGFVGVEESGKSIGRILSEKINIQFEFLNSFVHSLHWKSIGKFIADTISGFFQNIDWELIYDTFVTGAKGLGDAINSFADYLDWEAVSDSISNFFNTFIDTIYTLVTTADWKELGQKVGKAISDAWTGIDWKKAGEMLGEVFKAFFDFVGQAIEAIDWQAVGESVKDFLAGIDWAGVAESFFEAIGAAIGGIAAFLGDLISDGVEAAKQYFEDKIEECGGNVVEGIFKGITDALVNIGNWVSEHIFEPFIDGFKKAFGIHSPSTVMEEQGNFLMQGLFNGISALVGKVVSKFTEIKEKVIGVWTDLKAKTLKIWGSIKSAIKNPINSILASIESLMNGVIKGINFVIGALNGVSFDIPDWLKYVPGASSLAGKTFGLNIPELEQVSIPRLATGTVVPPNREFMAVLGDNKREPEVVSPISTMKQANKEAVLEALSELGLSAGSSRNGGNETFVFQVDGKTFFEITRSYAEDYFRRTGRSPFPI